MDEALRVRVSARVQETDGDLLIRAADGLEAACERFREDRGRVAGVRAGLVTEWDSAAGRAMLAHLETLSGALARADGALSLIAERLRRHGRLAAATREEVRCLVVAAYVDPLSTSIADLEGLLEAFLESEQGLADALWAGGASAPGGIPLPVPPPRPPRTWKTFLFGDDYPVGWHWADERGMPAGAERFDGAGPGGGLFDPDHPVYGYDEWGRLVPAYRAGMPIPMELVENSIGSGLLKLLGRAARAARVAPSGARAIAPGSDELAAIVRGSYGWRPAHIDRHIREWYRLADEAPVPAWMRDEYLTMIVEAGAKQGKVFTWTLRGESGAQETYAVLRYEQSAGRWMVSQYYAGGARAGEFATAFEPTGRQLARMLQQAAVR